MRVYRLARVYVLFHLEHAPIRFILERCKLPNVLYLTYYLDLLTYLIDK